jgi:cellulose synthase/poly-beta-1,6-N-acetylglucosamine synthase-like glycosyltransferase/peptidoglycan/xylan/chitin deacetylase (PgdA/CDA1 family)/spore germination protein YaaH
MSAVFHDPTDRRKHAVRAGALVVGLAAIAILTVFAATLLIAPVLPPLSAARAVARRILAPRAHKRRHAAQRALLAEIAKEKAQARGGRGDAIVAAFYAPWEETGLHSLRANADRLTHLMPAWLALTPDGRGLSDADWNPSVAIHNVEVVDIARQHGIALMPVLSNASEAQFDGNRAHVLLNDRSARANVVAATRQWLLVHRMAGINLDFENLSRADARKLPAFVAEMRAALAPAHLVTSVDVEASMEPELWTAVADAADLVVVMAYDEHSAASAPGPISSLTWYRGVLDQALKSVPPQKLVIGIGNYAYDWSDGDAAPVSYEQALITARDNFGGSAASQIDFDSDQLNPTFDYADADGTAHEVWMLDGVTAANEWRLARAAGVRGSAVWALGLEDPSTWLLFDRRAPRQFVDPHRLAEITFPWAIEFVGEGDILRVDATPAAGHRTLELDGASGLITDESYTRFPAAYVIRRSGLMPKSVALTIDDGPSEPYTNQLLDVLAKYRVKATFFVIGEEVEKYPELVSRIWNDGHDIGSHTYTHPNMADVSDIRTALELNATQRAIESVTGRSTMLFRPPYNADAEPTNREELVPILRASQFGYVTVGEYIDPRDWDHRSAPAIAKSILDAVHAGHGNSILLHDGGGNRTATVAAVKLVVPQLLAEGYRFVTVSQLMHASRDAVMPPAAAADRMFLEDDRVVFGATSRVQRFLFAAFLAAILLAVARVIVLALLALRKRNVAVAASAAEPPRITVLVAAYNEERVIAKTIASILRSRFVPHEIIVVDDGSTDGTSDVVAGIAGVTLIRQSNGGKASALNHGIRVATGEILVCVDADTVLHPDAISRLARHFADPRVAAVAGNVKVGNRGRLTTVLQALEYTTSQNLDRRAWASVNAITVVPGAVGAWRRDAVLDAGGYSTDTAAEDMDLTWQLRRNGWRIVADNEALCFTEAPEKIGALFRQRFRWAFGTLQCLWKHRGALGRYGWFGRAMLPALWLFQFAFQLLSPLVDIQLAFAAVEGTRLLLIGGLFLAFTLIDVVLAIVALRIEREPLRYAAAVVVQRFFFRQLLYAAIVKAVLTAVQGLRTGWGKLERAATVADLV